MNTCNICRKTYSTTSTLKRHQKTTKIHEKNSIVVLQSYFRKNLTKLPVEKLPILPVEILTKIFEEDIQTMFLVNKEFTEEYNYLAQTALPTEILAKIFDYSWHNGDIVYTTATLPLINRELYEEHCDNRDEYICEIKREILDNYLMILGKYLKPHFEDNDEYYEFLSDCQDEIIDFYENTFYDLIFHPVYLKEDAVSCFVQMMKLSF